MSAYLTAIQIVIACNGFKGICIINFIIILILLKILQNTN